MGTQDDLTGGWRPIRRTRAFEDVLAAIETRIAEEGLTAGDRLPGERRLAEQLGVGRSSIREAMRVLSTLGVVSAQTGSGPDAGAVLVSRPEIALADLLRLHLGLAGLSLREVVETRSMIEQWAAAHGAGRAAPGDLSGLRDALAGMEAAGSVEEFVTHDTAFHLAVAGLSGNRLMSATMRALRAAATGFAVEAVERLGGTGGLMADHREIYRAIAEGDGEAARAAVAGHLARTYPQT
ncbi:FCD domain-containing protein [Spongiactinospora sp. TRM90649]|uniref:FadR/GntR family transcriptional regulator n=1 Tax=Spongiactinospora sp. TRM90649 TaxID=3031114 RepID=UPI0023F87F68|nr:FCD domain-containing protein [Spongiactinospora sp. TRM90649]MDF5758691.1 FCD domain-containing protein [Spongiactinospora sp. TRM90649]